MTNAGRGPRARESWMPATAMLAIALLAVAAMLNGVGAVGVMAPSHPGHSGLVAPEGLARGEQVAFAGADRAIERLYLADSGRPERFEAYEGLLQALAESLPANPGEPALDRVGVLLARSLPAPAVDDLTAMLPSFLEYQEAEQAWLRLSPVAPGSVEGAYLHLRLQHALRETILGAQVAKKLYSDSYRMTEVHLVRRMLMLRDDLGEEEKRRLIRQQMEALTVQKSTETLP